MKRFAVILAGAVAGAAAVLWWRRTQASAPAPVQLGLADGSTLTLAAGDPGAAQLTAAADDVRRAFTAGP